MSVTKELQPKDVSSPAKPQLPSKDCSPSHMLATAGTGKSGRKVVRKIRTPEERLAFQSENLGRLAALTSRRLLSLCKSCNTNKYGNELSRKILGDALIVACRAGVFSDKYTKTGRAILKYLNRNSDTSGLRFAIDASGHIRGGKVTVLFDE